MKRSTFRSCGSVGADAAVFDAVERGGEVEAEVVLGVVGEDCFDGDRVRGEELLGAFPEPGARWVLFVREDLAEGQPAVRVDRRVRTDNRGPVTVPNRYHHDVV